MKLWWRRPNSPAPEPATASADFVRLAEAPAALKRIAAQNRAARHVDVVDVRLDRVLERHGVKGPTCHVGSKAWKGDEESVLALRRLLGRGGDFVGLDIEAGLNVDVVADICDPELFAKHPRLRGAFGFAYVAALLEHVDDPFAGARNIAGLLAEGGVLYSSHPWVWGFHPYPTDLWRFSFRAIRRLFDGIEWLEWWYASMNPQVGLRVRDGDPTIERKLFQTQRRDESLAGMLTDRWMPYLNVVAIGRRTVAPVSGPT
jgi:SAM-dependent methyltransferase